jgi:hypothetical protein
MMRNGRLYPPLTQGVATDGTGSSSSPGLLLFKTPTSQLGINGGSQHPSKRKAGGHGPTLADEVEHLLPTPQAHDRTGPKTLEQIEAQRRRGQPGVRNLNETAVHELAPLMPTPNATDHKGSGVSQGRPRNGGRVRGPGDMDLPEAVSLLPTPRTGDNRNSRVAVTGSNHQRHGRTAKGSASGLGLEQALESAQGMIPREFIPLEMLPTPAARDYKSGESNLLERNARPLNEVAVAHLRPSARDLLPTPTASLGTVEATAPWKDGVIWWKQSRASRNVAAIAESMFAQDVVDYGRYARSVLRWAQVINRLPPSPLEMSPRGTLVLSPPFVEWMMGLEPGWVTGLGLSRGAQLKLLGNGVVPQQVVLGLSILLPRVPVLWKQ